MSGLGLGLGLGLGGRRVGLDPATVAYIQRVEADGGVVGDKASVDDFFRSLTTANLLSNLVWGVMADGGLKYEAESPAYVSSWYDLASNRDAVQATPEAKPYIQAASINSKPALRFSGAQYMDFGADELINTGQPFTLITISKPKSIPDTGVSQYAVQVSINTNTETGMYSHGITSMSSYKLAFCGHPDGVKRRIDDATKIAVDVPFTFLSSYLGGGFNNLDQYLWRINGDDPTSTSARVFATTKVNNRIGAKGLIIEFLDAELAEILLFNASSSTLLTWINTYTKAKYNIGV